MMADLATGPLDLLNRGHYYVHKYKGRGWWEVHRDGTPWDEAPIPRRWHRCTVWSYIRIGGHSTIRCACGAEWFRGQWFDRNGRWYDRDVRRRAASW